MVAAGGVEIGVEDSIACCFSYAGVALGRGGERQDN